MHRRGFEHARRVRWRSSAKLRRTRSHLGLVCVRRLQPTDDRPERLGLKGKVPFQGRLRGLNPLHHRRQLLFGGRQLGLGLGQCRLMSTRRAPPFSVSNLALPVSVEPRPRARHTSVCTSLALTRSVSAALAFSRSSSWCICSSLASIILAWSSACCFCRAAVSTSA